ncbi:MAG: A24 family peptidase [Acidaminococcaceae bacterium]|nr:A24 family peptidase [Acidaminococcaceae bacterium]
MYYFLLMCFFSAMAVHCYTDMREQLLYDKVNVFLAGCGLWYGYFFTSPQVYLTGALVMGGIMLSIYWASRGGMGGGDVKLAFALGLWLGVMQGILCLLLSFVLGGVIGIVLCCSGRKKVSEAIPFGPCLCLGGTVALLWGTQIISWYLGLFSV